MAEKGGDASAPVLELPALPDVLPVLPLSDAVVFPFVIVPLSVDPERGVAAVEKALAGDRLVMLAARRNPQVDERSLDDLEPIGTAGSIMRLLKMPDGRMRILVQGLVRAELTSLSQVDPFARGRVRRLDPTPPDPSVSPLELEAMVRNLRDNLEAAVGLGKGISNDILGVAVAIDDPGRLADLVASNLELDLKTAQSVLELTEPVARLRRVDELLRRELDVLRTQHLISAQAQDEIDGSQREYFLRQQLRAIRRELGDEDELSEEIEGYRQTARERGMPDDAVEEMEKQIRRLERSHPESGETSILRASLDWLTDLPWGLCSEDDLDLARARRILDEEHHGLKQVKKRITEFLAVRSLKPDTRGPILCFVGPPGVGKTSLGRSIARTLGRNFVRLSLGGVRDEAEIRGHRRTYVGALPGRIVQGLQQAGTSNPVFMLDEIDKLGADHRGDPSAAMLEVLDPEQNSSFRDHYLGVAYDLSKVLFIATANLLDPIQPAFLDRMEIIGLSGYTVEEKLAIARRHLVPKQREANGLSADDLIFTDGGLRKIVTGYTREAGLRGFEREIAAVCRQRAVAVAERRDDDGSPLRPLRVDARRAARVLGPEKHALEELLATHRVGVATGLAWTAAGGDLMRIEAVLVPGRGRLRLTGRLGEVMRESAQAALSFVRGWAARQPADVLAPELRTSAEDAAQREGRVGDDDLFARHDVHIHAPAGAIPKDGPSAGITIATALVSVLCNRPVDREVAMTGEITLRGDILPIGGLKEKALAARAAGIRTMIVPKLNARDLEELPRTLRRALDIHRL
ncbi:MAG: endopeptidase La, partial [Acidobacteriota bacterium]